MAADTPTATVVIIGASFAGLQVANGLLKALPPSRAKVKVILIDPSDKWYFNIAAPRIVAKPAALRPEQYLLPIDKAFAKKKLAKDSFEFVKGRATRIHPASRTVAVEVSLSSGGTSSSSVSYDYKYDYLVIASGSSTSSASQGMYVPFKPTGTGADDLEAAISRTQKTLSEAKSVIIGGAGPIGVELAGELAEAWAGRTESDTSITLVSASERVLPMLKKSAGKAAEKLLAKRDVKVITSRKVVEAVQNDQKWTVKLDNGETLTADAYIATTGVVPNNRFIPAEYLNEDGWVEVDEYFRVKGKDEQQEKQPIYAVGDITAYPIRTSLKVAEQTPVVVANLKADILGSGKQRRYVEDEKKKIMMVVPVGAAGGTGQIMGLRVWGKLVSIAKGRDFLVSRAAGMVGLD
ncbi:hypothetical protein VTN96DRAFT_5939 [Rasamsonia emersonii]|uniref:AMID-like mitochondrial oxidoreductase n=1 Tax=Rasamsonia emersonii (strain ATCC 16479 / CBS 393.64 / IMI 116815) TaxID=1408163 RepID=A0A0F4YW17_RASE3|nr:AMID-like mitochondrial oxidoreductase [Rasamsonia emersonii CBS 393.64]KKA22280.1 AMID-like mitochondrial oxidoreductase [Rasamsonia emersonii CBS 393.64]